MDNKDLNPSLQPTIIQPTSHFAGMSTPNGFRFFDNSTLDTFRVCFRKGYFRHIRNWEPAGVRVPLVFGSSIHAALDTMWKEVCWEKNSDDHDVLLKAMKSFMEIWTEHNMEQREELDLFPRSPGRAAQILALYLDRYRSELERIELLAIEVPFIVPLNLDDEKLFYIGKWDKVFRQVSGINVIDHKTASSMQTSWQNSFSPNGQVDGYLHGGTMTYGDEFDMVLIDGLLVQKTNLDVQRLPCKRQSNQLDAWAWETSDLIDQIYYNEERLLTHRNQNVKPGFLPAFPKCTTSCTQYYGLCPYLDLCKYWNDPDQQTCPDGFIERKWEPFQITEKLDGTFDIALTEESD